MYHLTADSEVVFLLSFYAAWAAGIFFLTSSMRHPREIDLFTNLNENAIFPQPLV